MSHGYCLARAKYSSLTCQHGRCSPEKRAGLDRWVSRGVLKLEWDLENAYDMPADMIPSTPVSSKHLSTSPRNWMFPLAKTGIPTFSLHKKWAS